MKMILIDIKTLKKVEIFYNGVYINFVDYANSNKIINKIDKESEIILAQTNKMINAKEKEILIDKKLNKRYNNLIVSMFCSKGLKISYKKYTDENDN